MELELQEEIEASCSNIDEYFYLSDTERQMIFPILSLEAKKIIRVVDCFPPNENITYEEISIKTGYSPEEIELICSALLPYFDLTFVKDGVTYWEPDTA